MTDKATSIKYWVVNCLSCKNPIPLFAESEEVTSTDQDAKDSSALSSNRPFFRAWCHHCGREFPYLAESAISMSEPPLDKQHREVEFTRIKHRLPLDQQSI